VPGGTDHVLINSGSVTIPADGAFAIMDWTGGSLSGALTVASNAVLNVSGSAEKVFGPLTNFGSVLWKGGGQWVVNYRTDYGYYGAINNQPGALFDLQTDARLFYYSGNEVFTTRAACARARAAAPLTSIRSCSTPGAWKHIQEQSVSKMVFLPAEGNGCG